MDKHSLLTRNIHANKLKANTYLSRESQYMCLAFPLPNLPYSEAQILPLSYPTTLTSR